MNRPVMYLIANKGLGMSAGKLSAQVAHAAVRAAMLTARNQPDKHFSLAVVDEWLDAGETKLVLEARDTEHLLLSQQYIEGRGYKTHLVIDEGRTEIPPLSATCLGIEVVDKTDPDVQFTFETFKTYNEPAVGELHRQVQGLVEAVKSETDPDTWLRIAARARV